MGKYENLLGQQFGLWTVIADPDKKAKDNDRFWTCQCECGTIRDVRRSSLKKGASNSCGCYKKKKLSERTDLVGQRFDKLVVIKKSSTSTYGNIMWVCQCDCGNIVERSTTYLHRKNFKHSCGCAMVEHCKKDIANQRFGKLVAIEELKERNEAGRLLWLCHCDCGNQVKLPLSSLTSGNTSSCGCINYSIGEKNIETILLLHNIPFKSQYTCSELNLKRFDFAILDRDNGNPIRLIEFDGRQHFDDISGIWNSPESLEDIQYRDQKKNEWALAHNIPLVRIPYWERDNITLDLIMGDTYLVREAGQPTG